MRAKHRINLEKVVSKFVGETEKNLARLLDHAEHASGMLFFDEADALFGKRSTSAHLDTAPTPDAPNPERRHAASFGCSTSTG